jgi:hypothetical protein
VSESEPTQPATGGAEKDRALFDAYFWLISAAILWLITCVDGVLKMALGSTAYAWVGLLIASLCFSGIAAIYVTHAFRGTR